MKRPLLDSAKLAMLLQLVAILVGGRGAVRMVAELFAVYFALYFVMLLAFALFSNRAWRLTPALHWTVR